MAPIMSYARLMTRPGFSGTCIGAYHILEVFSSGNFDKAFLARHVLSGEIFTVRVIDKSYLRHDLTGNKQMISDLEQLREVAHESLERVYDVFASISHVFVVTEVATGVKFLNTVLKWRYLDESMARNMFRGLVEVVSTCHARGLSHRYLSPDCILLTADGKLKLSDFWKSGIVDRNNHLLPSSQLAVHCTAPEVWMSTSDGYDGAKADAFSLGVILYMMVTGAKPFEHSDELEVFSRVHRCEVEYPGYLSSGVVDLLGKLLVGDPGKRWDLSMVQVHPWFVGEANVFESKVLHEKCYGSGMYAQGWSNFKAAYADNGKRWC